MRLTAAKLAGEGLSEFVGAHEQSILLSPVLSRGLAAIVSAASAA